MKNNKNDKKIATLNYFISICFYIITIMNFLRGSTSTGIVFLCLGSTFLCLGSLYLNKENKEDKEDKENE